MASFNPLAKPMVTYRMNWIAYNRGSTAFKASTPRAHMKNGTLGHLTGPLTGGPAGAWAPLSSELEKMQAEYDVVVIGSGYGGGVASSRAARAGQKICIIERGKEYLPGDFPESQTQGLEETQITFAAGDEPQHKGNALGMADIRMYREVDVVLGCGLGGTSLINANVVMKPVKGVFSSPEWPKEVQTDIQSGAMNRDFDAVDKMLNPQLYPDWYPRISKLDALQEASLAPEFQGVPMFAKVNPTQPGFGFQRTPIAVTFGADPQFENGKSAAVATNINDFGVYQPPCNNCGNCCSGCNYGSKNTVDRNYLPDAKNWGADIFTKLRVSHIALAKDGKWLVHFEPAGLGREKFTKQLMFVRASSVFIAGGTLGSTEIMLRSKENGLALSDMVGKHYSGNGDTLGFSYKTQPRSVTIGFEAGVVDAHEPVGPCITGIIDLRNDVDTGAELDNQLIIEDGVAPGLLRSALGAALPILGRVDGLIKRLAKVVRPVARAMTRLVPVISLQNLVHVETFLVMSHDRRVDSPDDESQYGEMHLTASGKLNLRWPELAKLRNYTHAGDALKAASDQLGGMFIDNPLWRIGPFRPGKSVSVHSLGGCVMGEDGASGAVNHKCQVFNGNTASVHPGLYVCDGAVIPRSLGINPLFTISAMAERTMRHASDDLGWGPIDYTTKRMPLREPLVLERGVQFTETMKGFLSPVGNSSGLPDDDKQPLLEAEAQGNSNGTAFAFTMTYNNQDVLQLQSDPNAGDSLVGTVTATGIEGLTNGVVSNGKITLFGYDMDTTIGRKMHYKCTITDVSGAQWTLDGYKAVGGTWLLPDVWRDTTTLYTTVRSVGDAPVVWRGVLHILIPDLLVQLTTMKATNTTGLFGALKVLAKFFANFISTILATYTIPLLSWRRIFQSLQGARYGSETLRPLSSPGPGKHALKPEQHFFTTDDGQTLTLSRFKGGNEGPVLLGHGLGVSSLIFSTASVKENLLESLYGAGYDVFLVELRVSTKQKQSYSASNADEVARYDWPAAVEAVLNIAGTKQTSVFAHCYGATTLSMSILGGFLDCSKVRSIVISQATAVSKSSIFNRIKAHLFAPNIMEALGYSTFDVRVHGGWYSWFVQTFLVDTLAFWFKQGKYPDTNAVSRRITFTYGSLYILDNLNRNTYAALKDMFGIVNMPSLKHLALMARMGFVVDAKGGHVYWTEAGRKRWTAPTFFLHGAENKCFLPIGSQMTMDGLAKTNGAHLYERKVFPGYGHIDCIYGKDAYRDIFPEAVKFLNKQGAAH